MFYGKGLSCFKGWFLQNFPSMPFFYFSWRDSADLCWWKMFNHVEMFILVPVTNLTSLYFRPFRSAASADSPSVHWYLRWAVPPPTETSRRWESPTSKNTSMTMSKAIFFFITTVKCKSCLIYNLVNQSLIYVKLKVQRSFISLSHKEIKLHRTFLNLS